MKEFIVQYWWQILSVGISPLAGFALAQHFKVSQSVKPSASRIALVAGFATAVLATMLWPAGWVESAKIGVLIGVVQPFIVFVWFSLAHKFAPEQAARLTGSAEELTIIPGLKVRRKDPDITQPRD